MLAVTALNMAAGHWLPTAAKPAVGGCNGLDDWNLEAGMNSGVLCEVVGIIYWRHARRERRRSSRALARR